MGDSEIQCALSLRRVVYGCSCTEPVWLFVRAACLKTGSFTGRQDVELWTLGNTAAPSEPGLKQDGFVWARSPSCPSLPSPNPYLQGRRPRRCAPGAPPSLASQQLGVLLLSGSRSYLRATWPSLGPAQSLIKSALTSAGSQREAGQLTGSSMWYHKLDVLHIIRLFPFVKEY